MRTPHDRGSVLPCVVALVGVFSLVLLAMTQTAAHLVRTQRIQNVADALVLAIANEREIYPIITRHHVEKYTVWHVDEVVTVHVVIGGEVAQATATFHRPTLDTGP